MRLQQIYVENFQGLRRAELTLAAPVTLVCGANGAGKSSLKEAIGLALGEGARVQHKKDFGQLVTEGEKKAVVIVTHDDVSSSCALPKGTVERADIAGADYLHYVLEPAAFAAVDEKTRRAMLFKLTNASAGVEAIMAKLTERGASPAKAERIKPLLRAANGFNAAMDAAKTNATESRGAWKAITGEAYGSEKAESWTASAPAGEAEDVSPAAIDKVIEEYKVVDGHISEGTKWIGGQDEQRKQADGRAERLAKLEEAAGLLSRAEAKRDATQKGLETWEPKLADLQVKLREAQAGAGGCTCPDCGASLKIVGSKLEKYDGMVADTANTQTIAGEVQKAREAVDLYRRTLSNDLAAVAAAEQAAKDLEAAKAEQVEVFDQARYDKSVAKVTELRLTADKLRAKVNAMKDRQNELANADQNTAKAATHHQDVKDWTLIEKAMAPDGIPSELLASALAPFNASLAKASALANWPKVEIRSDMAITYGGRVYGLLSESEKWRTDLALALGVAQHSGLKLVLVDRFDVLDLPSRGQAIGMLKALAQSGKIDSALVLGTLKAAPASTPTLNSVWIEGGVAATGEALAKAG